MKFPLRKWRRTVDSQGRIISDAWSLIDPSGEVLAQIWLETDPHDEYFNRWKSLRFYSNDGNKIKFEWSHDTGKLAKQEMESLTPYFLRKDKINRR